MATGGRFEGSLDKTYAEFLAKVAAGRSLQAPTSARTPRLGANLRPHPAFTPAFAGENMRRGR